MMLDDVLTPLHPTAPASYLFFSRILSVKQAPLHIKTYFLVAWMLKLFYWRNNNALLTFDDGSDIAGRYGFLWIRTYSYRIYEFYIMKRIPSLLFWFKLVSMQFHEDYIFAMLNLAPFAIFLLGLWSWLTGGWEGLGSILVRVNR